MNKLEAIRRFHEILEWLNTPESVTEFAEALRTHRSAKDLVELPPINREIYAPFFERMLDALWPERLGDLPAELSQLLDATHSLRVEKKARRDEAMQKTFPVWDRQYLIIQCRMSQNTIPTSDRNIWRLFTTEHLILFHIAKEIELQINSELPYSEIGEAVRRIVSEASDLGVQLEVEGVRVESGSIRVIIVASALALALVVPGGPSAWLVGPAAWAASELGKGAFTVLAERLMGRVCTLLSRNEAECQPVASQLYEPSKMAESIAKMAATGVGCPENPAIEEMGKQIGQRLFYKYRFRPEDCGTARGVRIGLGLTPDIEPHVFLTY